MVKHILIILVCVWITSVDCGMWSWLWPWSSSDESARTSEIVTNLTIFQTNTTTTTHSSTTRSENNCLVQRSSDGYPFYIGRTNCYLQRSGDAHPFYIGRTNLFCMLYYRRRRKRTVNTPSVFTLILTHRWLHYRGVYFEFGTNALDPEAKNRISIQQFRPNEGEHCSYDENPDVAGYSKLSVNCIAACTMRYPKVFGEYSLLFNNCHVFVNKMVEVLCKNYDKCPDWCAEPLL